ncbi:RNA-directed DNA polymerase, eukaryota [Tanacetum coccineum]
MGPGDLSRPPSSKLKAGNPSLKYPPGFTPSVEKNGSKSKDDQVQNISDNQLNGDNESVHQVEREDNKNSDGAKTNSTGSRKFKMSEIPRTGGSILSVMEEIVKVGLAQKAKKDWVKELCNKNKVSFVGLQETKMESIDLLSVRLCWGNVNFDYVHSDSIGNSGGILCIWDPNSFRKDSVTVSDYFVIVRGVWIKSGMDILIVVVYAPHDVRDKRLLWDYLSHVSNQWAGEVVMMGDFNEVRYKSDRFGSNFNAHGADIFNNFIINAGLEEVPLGGSAYTWCHKSASKMSKLDRFLVSENLLNTCPNISAITLDRFLSDHRPILLREASFDYGPTPFRFFHFWFDVDGFDKFVTDSWKDAPGDDSNAMRNLCGKLKFLKVKIRAWYADYRNNSKGSVTNFKEELRILDELIDKGNGSDEIVNNRLEILGKLQQVNKAQASEVAQKAKIKWYVEGDENTKFFHGMLNKKRSQLNIRGIMINGTWTDNPKAVKQEFFQHFRNRFDKPPDQNAHIDMPFPNSLSTDQQKDLECMVSKEEVKRAVWDCGTDKSPGPDGFTFGFYRHFWSTIENDNPDANMVKDFRPISLIGSIYKIIAKILTNRLVGVLGDIVNEVQSAFISERQILDGPFILNEIMQWAYALESCKNIDVAYKLSQNSLAFTFRREPRGGVEQDQFDSLKAMVEGTSLINIRDRWNWSLQSSGYFTVASIRKLIDEFTLSEVSSSTRWIKAVPIKVNVLAWKIKLDNLPTRLNISRRGMYINSILCPTCGKAVESTKHIFFTCQIARDILHLITSWWNIPYMKVSSYEEWLVWILSLRLSIKHKRIFEGVCYVTWWHIWNFRNKTIFGSESPSKAAIFDEVQFRYFYWCRYRCKTYFIWIE